MASGCILVPTFYLINTEPFYETSRRNAALMQRTPFSLVVAETLATAILPGELYMMYKCMLRAWREYGRSAALL